MKCKECGNEIPEGSKFCTICGARMTAPEAVEEPVAKATTEIVTNTKPEAVSKPAPEIVPDPVPVPVPVPTPAPAPAPAQAPAPAPVQRQTPFYQPAPQYQAAPAPARRQRNYTAIPGKSGGWIVFARILLWISFALIILTGIITGVSLIIMGSATGSFSSGLEADISATQISYDISDFDSDAYLENLGQSLAGVGVVVGIMIMLGSVVVAFISVCVGFVALGACTNLKNMNDNLATLIRATADNGNTTDSIEAITSDINRKA